MKIDKLYLEGVVDSMLYDYECINGSINPEKELNYYFDEVISSSNSGTIIGCDINFSWIRVHNREDFESHEYGTNRLRIFTKDNLGGVMADIATILHDIDNEEFIIN